jgi:hypothetical protein
MKNPLPPKTKTPVLPLPPWKSGKPEDQEWLIDWTNDRLDEEHAISDMFIHLGDSSPALVPTFEYAMEVWREKGDKSLIERVDPAFAKNPSPYRKPSGKRGGGRQADEKHGDKIWQAVWDVKLIRDIWKQYYGGDFYRSTKDKVTAEKIAKARNHLETRLDTKTFDSRLHHLGDSKAR